MSSHMPCHVATAGMRAAHMQHMTDYMPHMMPNGKLPPAADTAEAVLVSSSTAGSSSSTATIRRALQPAWA